MNHPAPFPVRERITSFIDGQWLAPGGKALSIVDPASERQVATLYGADEAQTSAAVEAAHRSFAKRTWVDMGTASKQAVFRRIVDLTRSRLDELAWLECLNTGIPYHYMRERQLPRILRNFSFFADSMSQGVEKAATQDGEYLRFVVREPVGVAALISPWNAPLALASTKIAAALAFGNSCVVKCAEQTPLAVARFMDILAEAGVPPGVVNLVNGLGEVTGRALVRHPLVKAISFTGGTQTGRSIAADAAPLLKRVDLELGGKSANIVAASAPFEDALDGALTSIFTNNGQQCFAGSRILVHRSIAGRFIESFVARARRIRVGHPHDAATEVGPLANAAHYGRVLSYVTLARREGSQLLTGGERPADHPVGYYLQPTALLARSNRDRVCQEEIFGPVVAFEVFDDFDEAIAIANDSSFGLVSYLWSNDLSECLRAVTKIEAGTVLVNTPMSLDLRLPFAGYKESGLGQEGMEGFRRLYTQEKTAAVALRRPAMARLGAGPA